MTDIRFRGAVRGAVLLAVVAVSAGCAADRPPAEPRATVAPADTRPLVEVGNATVIDREGKAEACGGVMLSAPPQCAGGVTLLGWDWDDAGAGTFERNGDVRWGEYGITGIWDGESMTLEVVSVSPPEQGAPPPTETHTLYSTRCEAPAGGWVILDEATASQQALHAATALAVTLDGYATAWIDRTLVPQVPAGTDPIDELHNEAVNAGLSIINVGVSENAEVAEAQLRAVWGGALCVFETDHTQAELDARLEEITASHALTSAWPDGRSGVVHIGVVFDADDELQREMDAQYGAGAVRVSSYLTRVG